MLLTALPNSKPHGKVDETQFLEYLYHANHLSEKFPFQSASAFERGANHLAFTLTQARSFVRPLHLSYLTSEKDSQSEIEYGKCIVGNIQKFSTSKKELTIF